MATATHISLSEYLDTSYRPDCEYVDGEVRERNVGKWEHSRLQWLLALWFGRHEQDWGIVGSTEQRIQIAGNKVRVPDLVVLLPGPQPDVLTDPPLLVIEILSPKDTYTETEERARDYREMGVPMVWILDPRTRSGRMCAGTAWVEANRLEVPGTPLYIELDALFRQLHPHAEESPAS
jgi:Uma2 family endonuclease